MQLSTETTTSTLVNEQSSGQTIPMNSNIQRIHRANRYIDRPTTVNYIRRNNLPNFNVRKKPDEDCSEARQFGIAFGLAWKKFKSHE